MDLLETIEFVRRHEKELALFNLPEDESIAEELSRFFDTQNVRICTYRTATGRPEIAVLASEDVVLEEVQVSRLRELVSGASAEADGVGISDMAYEGVLGHLKETTFTSYDIEKMLYASREVEDRARRLGQGTIYAGFQTTSTMLEQEPIYTDLSERGVTVQTYAVPDEQSPAVERASVYTVHSDEIARTWFVVYDGNGDDTQKSALLAEQRASDSFYGAWTYDADIVDSICMHLETAYPPQNTQQRQSSE